MTDTSADTSATPAPAAPKTAKPAVVIYPDGACKRNPGPGGWGA